MAELDQRKMPRALACVVASRSSDGARLSDVTTEPSRSTWAAVKAYSCTVIIIRITYAIPGASKAEIWKGDLVAAYTAFALLFC